METYEAMFVVDPVAAQKDWNAVQREIETAVKKEGAEILNFTRWGERKLAYPIRKNGRGTYVLVFFKSQPGSVSKIRENFRLSETVMRTLILSHEGEIKIPPMPQQMMPGSMPMGSMR